MGIFRKIFAWTSDEASVAVDNNEKTVSRPIRQNVSTRNISDAFPTPVGLAPGLAVVDSNVEELTPCSLENSGPPYGIPTQNQTPDLFGTSLERNKGNTCGLQSNEPDRSAAPDDRFLDQVVDAFDEAFDAACSSDLSAQSGNVAGAVESPVDEATVQDLFAQIAASYSQPLGNFVFELKRGTASKDRIEFLRSSLQMIGKAATKMDLADAVQRITDFDEVLSMAQTRSERLIAGRTRTLILDSYQALSEVLPEVFRSGQEQQKREDLIIKSVLQQVPGIGRVTLDKLYKAGLGSLEALFLVNKDDLAAATSIPVPLCEQIADKFQQYRADVERRSQPDAQSAHQADLARLVDELRHRNEELESVVAGADLNTGLAAQRRRRRQRRQHCFLQIVAVLAELGEVELINKIQRLSFKQRLKRLAEHLRSLDREGVGAPVHSA